MEVIFEAKYISIKWYDKNRVEKIDEAILPISIEIENDTTYSMELQTYKRIENGLDGQVAFNLLDAENTIEPYFLDASNRKVPLLKITDPKTGKIWWIEDGKWSKKYKYRGSILWNHIGDAKVKFGDILCNINIRANSFTKEQLELYLNDFRNDFWYLILQNDSLTQGDAKNKKIKLLNKNNVKLISKFIEYSEKILLNPKRELREIQSLKDIKKVKPVARTFMEIATSGFKKKLTSRDTIESYNVAENRYIHYTLHQVYTIVFNILNATGHIEELYKNKAKSDEARLKNFSDFKTIDKEVFKNDIDELERKIIEEKERLRTSISKQSDSLKKELNKEMNSQISINKKIEKALNLQIEPYNPNIPQKFIIKLENRQNDYGNTAQFWGKIKQHESNEWDIFEINNWLSLQFNKELFSFLQPNQEYLIEADNIYNKVPTQKGFIHKIFFRYITRLELLSKEIEQENILEYKTVIIELHSKKEYQDLVQCSGKIQISNNEWSILENKNDFYSFEFDKNIFMDVFINFQTYKISGYIESRKQSWKKNGKNGVIHKKYFKYITNIELVGNSNLEKELNSLKKQKPNLEKSNWQRPLSSQEREEQENEKQTLKENLNKLKDEQRDNLELIKTLEPSLNKLKKLLLKYKKLKIKQDSYFPNSMTFIQNPNYQGSQNYFKQIKNIVGINESLFIQMQLVEKIGLLDIPTIYERWCFLQIIKVLIDKYHFTPEKDWKNKLALQTVGNLNNLKNIKVTFTNKKIERKIDLWYEKELLSQKRPDFVLDIKSTFGTNKTHRLVMDAKFHEEVNIKEQIDLLYKQKDYSENNKNTVFILHPDANKSIKKKRTPKDWGSDAYYGEVEMFNFSWDKDTKPNHKYGTILLSPIGRSGNFLDNLQRLIGMNLQYNLEDNLNIKINNKNKIEEINPIAKEKIFCLVCGSNNCEVSSPIRASKYSNRWMYKIKCKEKTCKHYFEYNYCWNCKNRLIKNGLYWSYHSGQVLNPFDIKCPNCNKLLSELPKGDDNSELYTLY